MIKPTLLLLVSAAFLLAQTGPQAPITGTYAARPATAPTGQLYIVNDDASVGACTGGGSAASLCRWSGAAWVALGDGNTGSGSGPVYTTTTYSATPTFSVSTSTIQVFTITLTGNVTSSTLSGSLTNGQDVTFNICQDGTGSRTFVWPTNVTGAATINPQLSTCSRQTFRYDGTNAVAATSITCPACSPAVIIPGSSSGQSTIVAPATGGGTVTLFSGSGTVTQTIASGTSALGTSAISANSCATVVTTTATGTASTDAISYSPNADISSVTGYGVLSTDGLIIFPYPTSNNVNWRVCNATGTSITPGAVTLNWRVTR